jgi:20S proteasome alpha/beta subunit
MTLLVGVWCQDGAVFAADKQTTHGTAGAMTVGHPTTKIVTLKKKVLFACSGHRGLGQQLAAALFSHVDKFDGRPVADAAKDIQASFRELAGPAFSMAQQAAPFIGQQAAGGDVTVGSILAAKFNDGISIVEITRVGAVEFYSKELPFICLGSGKQNADPILAHLWSIYFPPPAVPTLAEGQLMAYWTVKAAIGMASPLIGLGIDVFVLDPKANPQARELTDDEVKQHDEFINEAANALRSVPDTMRGKAEKLPDVPQIKK